MNCLKIALIFLLSTSCSPAKEGTSCDNGLKQVLLLKDKISIMLPSYSTVISEISKAPFEPNEKIESTHYFSEDRRSSCMITIHDYRPFEHTAQNEKFLIDEAKFSFYYGADPSFKISELKERKFGDGKIFSFRYTSSKLPAFDFQSIGFYHEGYSVIIRLKLENTTSQYDPKYADCIVESIKTL